MYKSILFIVLALLCVGCVQKVNQPEVDPYPYVIIDSSLSALEQEKITETVLDDGSTVIVFQVWNKSRNPLEGWRRIEWFDARGLLAKGLESGVWVRFTAQPKSFLSFQMVSPVPNVSGYRLNLTKSIKREKRKDES